MEQEATQLLAAFAATLDVDRMPEPVLVQCKNLLLDALACAVAGHAGEETPQVAAFTTALAPGLGTSIVEALARQLEAKVQISGTSHGTTVSITHGAIAARLPAAA